MKLLLLFLLSLFTILNSPFSVHADLIQLKDGRTLTGTLRRESAETVVIDLARVEGEKQQSLSLTSDQILRVTLVSNITPAQAAEAEWTRTAALIQKAPDLDSIVDLHQKFLDKFPNEILSASVRTSLGEYEKLQRQKAVKFRGRWLPLVQVEVLLRTWDDQAKPAVDLYRAGKIREALEASAKLSIADPENPIALTIAGLSSYRLSNLNTAREYFKKLAQVDPSTPLPENNLAVIAAQQKNTVESLGHYLKALQSSPDNRMLLDNIEEALANYTGDRTIYVYAELLHHFDLAETRMEAAMAKQPITAGGPLFRWGSTWVNRDQFDRLSSYRNSVLNAMHQLDVRFTTARQTLTNLRDQINQAATDFNNTLNSINSLNNVVISQGPYGTDVTSVVQRDQLLLDLTTIRAHKTALENQYDQLALSMGDFFATVEKLKAALAVSDASLYPGIQRIMQLGEDRNPPPPLPIALARIPGIIQPTQNPVPVPVASPDQRAQQKINKVYDHLATPIGLPMPAR